MEFGSATKAIAWRPARRLRHVVAVSLFNLFHPGYPNNLGPSSARSRYHYEVDTWDGQNASWVPFYRSEQVPYDSNLDWDRLALDPESPAALSGLQHRADAGPVRLRIRACHPHAPAAGQHRLAASAAATWDGAAWRGSTQGSGAQGRTWRGSAADAGGVGGGGGGRSLHQEQAPAPSDYAAQRLPHAHLRRRAPGPPSPPPPPPETAPATAGPGAATDSRQMSQGGPGSGALGDRGGSDSVLLVPTPASSGDTDSSSSSSSSVKCSISTGPAEAAAHDCDSGNGGTASPAEGSGPGLGAKASAHGGAGPPGVAHLPWCNGLGTAEAGRETGWEGGAAHGGDHGGLQWTQHSDGAPEVCSHGVGQQEQGLQQVDEVDLVVEELVEWVCRHDQWGRGECEGPARGQEQAEEPAGALEGQGVGEAAQPEGQQQQHPEQAEEQLGSAGSITGAPAPSVSDQHVPHGNVVAGSSGLGAAAGVQALVQGMPSDQALHPGMVRHGGSSSAVPSAAISSGYTASSAEGGERELPPQHVCEEHCNQDSGSEASMPSHPSNASADAAAAAAAGAAESEVVAEYIFDMRELVPLEPRALQRSAWCANVPLLLLQDRQLYTLPSALPRPPAPKPQPGPATTASSRTLCAPRPRSHTAAAALPSFAGRGPVGQGSHRPTGHAHGGHVGGRMAVAEAEAAAGRAGPPVRVRHAHRASLDERQMHSAAGGAGGGGRGGGARAIGGGQEGRLADDKRALLRWMLGSGSLVTPLEAATSLDSELDEELGSLEGLGELDGLGGLGLGCLDAAAGAVTAAAVQLQAHQPQQAGTAPGGAAKVQAALGAAAGEGDGGGGDETFRRPDAEALLQTLLRERPGGVDGSGDGDDLAAALLDPGPPPGFLPGALAVLFGQDLPERASHTAAAPPHSRRAAHSRSQSQEALSFLAHNAIISTPAAEGAAPASPRTLFGLLSRRAASTPAVRGASASGGRGQRGVSGPGAAGVSEEQEAAQEEEEDTITQEELLALAGMGPGGGSEEGDRNGDGLNGESSKGGSEWGSSVGGLTAASSASDLAGRGVGGEAVGGLGARQGGSRVWGSSSGAGGGPVSVGAAPVRAPHAAAGWAGSGHMPRGASTGSLADNTTANLSGPVGSAAAGGGSGVGAGAAGSVLLRGVLRRPPRPVGGAESMPVSRSSSPAPTAGLQPLHQAAKGSSRQQQHQQHGGQQRQRPGTAWSAGSGRGGKGQGQQQRMCDVGEVYASIRRLSEQQERLRRARSASLAAQQRLAAALEARRRREEAAVAAERISTECVLWRHRAAVAGSQLALLHGAAVRQRALLLARAGALEHAAGVLQAAETRRLGAEAQLQGPGGFPQLRQLHAALVARRNRMMVELGRIYQIGPVSEALLEPAPLDVTLDCSWAGEAGCAGEDQEAGTGGAGAGSSHHLNGTCPDQRQQQQFKVAGASGRQGQHALAPAAPCAAGGGAGGGGGGGGGRALGAAAQAVAAVPPRAMRLAVVGLEVMPDLVQRSLENASGWSPLDLGRAYDGDQRTAASLGYLAAVVDLAAAYLGVPLRYPVAPRMSVSYISDPVPPSVAVRSGLAPSTPTHPPQATGQGTGVSGGGAAAASTSSGLGSFAPGGEWRLLNVAVGMLSGGAAAATAAAASSQLPVSSAVGTLPGPRTAATGGGGGGGGRLAVFSTLLNTQLDPRVAHTPLGPPPEDSHPAGLCPASGLPLFWGEGARDRTRFAYAVYLLNKNVEQLLAAHGMPPVATNQPLVNLYALVNAAVSGLADAAAVSAAAKARQRGVQRREAGEGR